jgi:hypothetical protein
MHPPADVNPSEMILKDFAWYATYRPANAEDIFVWRALKVENYKNKKRKK